MLEISAWTFSVLVAAAVVAAEAVELLHMERHMVMVEAARVLSAGAAQHLAR
jgi:hypothetical protein